MHSRARCSGLSNGRDATGLFIDAHDHSVLGVDVKPDNVANLVDQKWIRRQFECFTPVWLQPKSRPNTASRHMTVTGRFRHRPVTPMRRIARRALQVRMITSSICVSSIWRGAPGRGSPKSPATRLVTKRARHSVAVVRDIRSRRGYCHGLHCTSNTKRARQASAGADLERCAIDSNSCRSVSVSINDAFGQPGRRPE